MMNKNTTTTTTSSFITTTSTMNKKNKNPLLIKDSSSSSSSISDQDYMIMSGFPWPPRSYTCSFCRKEFKSAQALGGHMNVHRRDRARLRHQSPPPPPPLPPLSTPSPHHHQPPILNLNLNPNNINNNNLSYKKPSTTTLPLFVMDGVLLSPLSTKPKKASCEDNVGGYDGNFAREDEDEDDEGCKILKKGEIFMVDLEIGLPIPSSSTTTTRVVEYDLDLELRLGTCS